jgi:hypothetical protein
MQLRDVRIFKHPIKSLTFFIKACVYTKQIQLYDKMTTIRMLLKYAQLKIEYIFPNFSY